MKYRGKNKINGNFVYGYYFVNGGTHQIHSGHTIYPVYTDSISIYFGKKDKNGKEIYTNDKVKYKGKEYEVRYFEEYGAFGLYDEKDNRPLGRSGSSTKYEPYFMNDYHTKQMEIVKESWSFIEAEKTIKEQKEKQNIIKSDKGYGLIFE